MWRGKLARHIIVVAYDPRWVEQYNSEALKIKGILQDNCVTIHHIGSTAVKGLYAKPIIDIMPVVHSLEEVDGVSTEFEKIGYEYMGEFGIKGRRYLRKGGNDRTHHIHIFREDNTADISRHLAVRDYLRTHKDVCEKYSALKRTLAQKYPYDIDSYCDGKDSFVRQMEKDAMIWKEQTT